MAGADYLHCFICDAKAVYDADWCDRVDPDHWKGDIKALCEDCAKTHQLVAIEREPATKPGRIEPFRSNMTREDSE